MVPIEEGRGKVSSRAPFLPPFPGNLSVILLHSTFFLLWRLNGCRVLTILDV